MEYMDARIECWGWGVVIPPPPPIMVTIKQFNNMGLPSMLTWFMITIPKLVGYIDSKPCINQNNTKINKSH